MEPLEKILLVASELFSRYGFKSITMDDISRRAGISKKTLYQHFANKAEVVSEAVSWYQNQITEECRKRIRESENAIDAIFRTQVYLDTTLQQLHPMILMDLQRYYPEAYVLFQTKIQEVDVAIVRQLLEEGMASGLFRKDIHADLLARLRIETCLLLTQPNMMIDQGYTLPQVSQAICEHFLHGVTTPKGEAYLNQNKSKLQNSITS